MVRIGGKGMTSKLDRIQGNANKYIVRIVLVILQKVVITTVGQIKILGARMLPTAL